MPVRAFLDSDSALTICHACSIGMVSMPVRAFLDSDCAAELCDGGGL